MHTGRYNRINGCCLLRCILFCCLLEFLNTTSYQTSIRIALIVGKVWGSFKLQVQVFIISLMAFLIEDRVFIPEFLWTRNVWWRMRERTYPYTIHSPNTYEMKSKVVRTEIHAQYTIVCKTFMGVGGCSWRHQHNIVLNYNSIIYQLCIRLFNTLNVYEWNRDVTAHESNMRDILHENLETILGCKLCTCSEGNLN